MNFELTVAESFDSPWSLLQSLHINFLTSNSCECPHRLLDLIVKERDIRRSPCLWGRIIERMFGLTREIS